MTPERLALITSNTGEGFDGIPKDKRKILDRLLSDKDLIELLNNPKLKCAEDHFNVNIFTHIVIPGIQRNVKNYVCFEVNDTKDLYSNSVMLNKEIIFLVCSDEQDTRTSWDLDRYDLMGYIITDLFNWSNLLGTHIKKVSDVADTAPNGDHYRIIKFESVTLNTLVNGVKKNIYDT